MKKSLTTIAVRAGGEVADDFENKRRFHRDQLRYDSAGDVQAGGLPVGEGEFGVGE